MRLNLFLVYIVSFMLCSCIQNSEDDRIPIRYTVLVRDRNSGEMIEGASVSLAGETGEEQILKTNDDGRVSFPPIESYVNQVIVSKSGYIPVDTVDIVANLDTSLSVLLRTLNLSMLSDEDSAEVLEKYYSYVLLILDESSGLVLSGASVSVISGNSVADSTMSDENGRVFFDSLCSKRNLFSISKDDYISRDTLVVASDSSSDEVSLQSLKIVLSPLVSE